MSGPLYDGNLYYEPEDINKEVETLARIMCPLLEVNFNSAPRKEWEYSSCCECLVKSGCDGCGVIDEAQRAIKAGYRKASEVAEEIFADIMSAIEQGNSNADTRIKDLAPHTYTVMMQIGKVYAGEIGKAICQAFKKYTEGEK